MSEKSMFCVLTADSQIHLVMALCHGIPRCSVGRIGSYQGIFGYLQDRTFHKCQTLSAVSQRNSSKIFLHISPSAKVARLMLKLGPLFMPCHASRAGNKLKLGWNILIKSAPIKFAQSIMTYQCWSQLIILKQEFPPNWNNCQAQGLFLDIYDF